MSGYDFRDACEAGDLDKVKGTAILLTLNNCNFCGKQKDS